MKYLALILELCLISTILIIVGINVNSQSLTCQNPPIETSTGGKAWPPNQTINVYVQASDFPSQTERDAINRAFNNWQSSGGTIGNGSGVSFNVTFVSALPSPRPTGAMSIQRNTTATTGAYTNISTSGSYVNDTITNIHPNVTDPNELAGIMAHEIGHTFGLGNCDYPDCSSGGSIMASRTCQGSPNFQTCNALGVNGTFGPYPGIQGPTTCDNNIVRETAGYGNQCIDNDFDGVCGFLDCNDSDYNPDDICFGTGCDPVEKQDCKSRPASQGGGGAMLPAHANASLEPFAILRLLYS
ncbi:MAG TPA: hypothetical protein VJS44_07290 [Pyrinomonadaceae bacterium]|nr:hypothetical protein [Pyrinomonadaceae bacterium]